MKFTKMHGIGNDYVYVNCFEEKVTDPAAAARFVSDRHFGIGSDGLILICPSEKADVRMEMYVRGATIDAIKDANAKVNRAIKGCAYAIGCEVEITDLPGYLPVADNLDLAYVFEDNAKALFPEKITRHEEGIGGGSSDVGDVQSIIPCIQGGMGGFENAFHSKDFRLVDDDLAFIAPAKVMACTVIDLLADDAAKAKEIIEKFDSPYNSKNYDSIWEDIMGK